MDSLSRSSGFSSTEHWTASIRGRPRRSSTGWRRQPVAGTGSRRCLLGVRSATLVGSAHANDGMPSAAQAPLPAVRSTDDRQREELAMSNTSDPPVVTKHQLHADRKPAAVRRHAISQSYCPPAPGAINRPVTSRVAHVEATGLGQGYTSRAIAPGMTPPATPIAP